jgi:hypothetical protein
MKTTSIPYNHESKRGTWMYDPDSEAPMIRCPNGHGSVMKNHVMEADGTSKGSVQCPLCDWHVMVKLEGWGKVMDEQSKRKQEIAEMSRDELEEYALVLSRLLADRDELVNLIPPCPEHGTQCIPHAKEWVMQQLAKENKADE